MTSVDALISKDQARDRRDQYWFVGSKRVSEIKSRIPEYTANFCFGDDDLCSLYVTASTSIYRVRVNTTGTAQWGSSTVPR